jgi:hypothetical protein
MVRMRSIERVNTLQHKLVKMIFKLVRKSLSLV